MTSALRTSGSTRAWRSLRAQYTATLPVPCPYCRQPVLPTQPWDLDHAVPRSLGGGDDTLRPAHRSCNRAHARAIAVARADRIFSGPSRAGQRPLSAIPPDPPDDDQSGLGPEDAAWDRCDWLDQLRDVPANATWPRLMTGPHPAAVGSFGAQATRWLAEDIGLELRWWQQLWLTRALEHDADGLLVWLTLLTSTARQVGKSVGVRGLASWRIHQAPLFGEEQLVLHTGKDLPVCKEVQRPARLWAKDHRDQGYGAREQNGNEEVTAPDGSRWIVRGKDSVYSYAATLGIGDEAWGLSPGVVQDGLEPTLAERVSPQLLLASTAHRKTTRLFPSWRAAAIGSLLAPTSTLLLEWSAPRGTDITDRAGWRAASPYWSAGRERLLEAKLERALAGESDDPDEDDPIESFKSQFLNIWPKRAALALVRRDERFVHVAEWADAADATVRLPRSGLVVAVEDWFGHGAAAAAAGMAGDGRVVVAGELFESREAACAWAASMASSGPDSRLLAGASVVADPAVVAAAAGTVDGKPAPVGTVATAAALPTVRTLLREGRLTHDGSTALAGQVTGLWVAPSRAGGLLPSRRGRSDLVRCVAWAVAEVNRMPSLELPMVFV